MYRLRVPRGARGFTATVSGHNNTLSALYLGYGAWEVQLDAEDWQDEDTSSFEFKVQMICAQGVRVRSQFEFVPRTTADINISI